MATHHFRSVRRQNAVNRYTRTSFYWHLYDSIHRWDNPRWLCTSLLQYDRSYTSVRVNPTTFWYWYSRTFKDPEVAFSKTNSRQKFTAIFNIYFCDYGTVLVDKNKTWHLLANLVLGKTPVKRSCWHRAVWLGEFKDWICGMKFKDLQAPVLFSSTFKALNLGEKFKYFQGLSKMHGNPDLLPSLQLHVHC